MTMPAALQSIEEDAFADNGAIERVVLGGQVTAIESHAFANNGALRQIEIPNRSIGIVENAFENSTPTILCAEDSTAHIYAVEQGFGYAFID